MLCADDASNTGEAITIVFSVVAHSAHEAEVLLDRARTRSAGHTALNLDISPTPTGRTPGSRPVNLLGLYA